MNKIAPQVALCAFYRTNEPIARLANEIAIDASANVYVGRFIDEDTGDSFPGFRLQPLDRQN